ncbi:MAG: GatB/YqeY domain-containing protein [Paludibacteraceae bacterium]|nr:GatB/YqeY domain-containing protein [Paludibacteraceae bacterium]MBR1786118.1 GatB/YqeY domain-containing protein [Paludibacteraceae bacterium]
MSLFDTISEDIKKAMLAKDRTALDALRGVKKEFLEAKTAKGGDGELHDDQALKILQKMVKQRKEAADMYQAANRQDLVDNELAQAAIIERYLPKMLSEDELRLALQNIIAQTGASSPKDMGRVMGEATKQLAGRADGKQIATLVKQMLQ